MLAEQLPQLILPGQPDHAVGFDRVQRPLHRPVEVKPRLAVLGDQLDHHVADGEDRVGDLRLGDVEHVTVGRGPGNERARAEPRGRERSRVQSTQPALAPDVGSRRDRRPRAGLVSRPRRSPPRRSGGGTARTGPMRPASRRRLPLRAVDLAGPGRADRPAATSSCATWSSWRSVSRCSSAASAGIGLIVWGEPPNDEAVEPGAAGRCRHTRRRSTPPRRASWTSEPDSHHRLRRRW